MNRLLLMIDKKRDRELLAQWLRDKYTLTAAVDASALAWPFDLCVVDGPVLSRMKEAVARCKANEAEAFLPVLLVTSRREVSLLTGQIWQVIDEVVTTPIEKAELHARVEVLLRSRRLSLEVNRLKNCRLQEVEQSLRESESRYRSLFENNHAVMLLINPDNGDIVDANPAAARYYGWTRAQLREKKISEINTLSPEQVRAEMEAARSERRNHFLFKHRLADGSIRGVEVFSGPIRVEGKTLLYSLVFDVTQRLETEERLKISRFCLDHAAIGIFRIDEDGCIVDVNQYACQGLGYEREELCRMTVFDIDPTFDRESWLAFRRSMRSQRHGAIETLHRRKDGSTFPVEVTVSYFEYGDQSLSFSFALDVSERKRDEQRRKELEAQLHQAQKMEAVGRLAGGVAHDFNNILGVILGYVEMIGYDLPDSHPHREPLMEIRQGAIRARDLTRQLLAFSRKQVLEMRTVDLNQVVTGFEKLLRRVIGEDIELQLQLATTSPMVRADSSQLEQVLMNLAVNARDAMPAGGALSIETAVVELDEVQAAGRPEVKPGPHAVISVRDNGAGMDRDTLERIFEPFFTTKAQDRGTGLGLATCYGIVKQHGGHIWVYSEPGQGTTFKIYLPIALEEMHAEAQAVEGPALARGSATVLVAEDDASLRKIACTVLENHGYRVLESENVRDAVRLAREHDAPIDLLLTDVVMPEMKGPEVYRLIRDHHPAVKVLYMSGYTNDMIVQHGVLEKDLELIQKPFAIRELLRKVAQVLASG